MNLQSEIAREIRAERYDLTPEGVYLPRLGGVLHGEYFGRVNGGEWQKEGDNLIVTEGFAQLLNVALGVTAKPSGYYLAIFSGSTAPAANWTAASFAAVASEIVSQTEGHTAATRQVWTPPAAAISIASIDNMASVAKLTFATASVLNVTGAALLTSNQRGGTTGALVSASLYAAPRVFQNGDTYDLGYRVSLTT
jgi:hypothetical protein